VNVLRKEINMASVNASGSPGPINDQPPHAIGQQERLAVSDAPFPRPVKENSAIEDIERAIEQQHERLDCLDSTDPDRPHILYEESIV
jgi:hypothetical protein